MDVVRTQLDQVVTTELRPPQWYALISWATDVLQNGVRGPEPTLKTSKLLHHLNRREFQVAAAEFTKWALVRGHLSPVALKKRQYEQRMFLKGQ